MRRHNHLIEECPKPPKDKNKKAFVGGSWSDSSEEDDEKVKDETCLLSAYASREVGAFMTHKTGEQNLCAVEESKAKDEANVEDTSYPGKEDRLDSLSFIAWEKAALMTFSEDILIRRSQSQSLCSPRRVSFHWLTNNAIMVNRSSLPSSTVSGVKPAKKSKAVEVIAIVSREAEAKVLVASSLELESLIEFPARPTLRSLELPSKSQKPVSFFNSFRTFRPVRAPFPPYAPPAQAYHASRLRRFRQTVFASSAILPAGCMGGVYLCARFQETPKTSHLEAVKRIFRYIKGTTHLGLWYPKGTGIEIIVYADSDHARDYVDRKSTSGICTFVGCCLTSWFSKKQTALAISNTEAEYVSTGKACQQALWMKQALIDYDVRLDDVPIMCDNKGAIDLSKNLVQHSRTKHIKIRHHFLRANVQKGHIFIEKVPSVDNIADILTKPLKRESFNYLLDELIYGIPTDGPYQTNLPPIKDIISSIRVDRNGQVCRIRHEEEIDVLEYQVLTCEIEPSLKALEEIIWENVFCLGGNRDYVLACLCFMLYYVVHSKKFNLAYYIAKRMEWVTKQARLLLPYGMLLTRLFTFIMNENPELNNESYVLYDHVMTPLAAQLERKPRRNRGMRRGRHSTSSYSAFDQPSSSHLNDDDYGNDKGTSRASTPSPIRYVTSLTDQVSQESQKVVEEHEEVRYEGITLRHYYIYYLLNYYA
ncbi:hypothetical protein Tco_1571321 [Tanacetum coccineum]